MIPLQNYYSTFESIPEPKVELSLPLESNPIDISNHAISVTSDGTPILKNKLFEMTYSTPETNYVESVYPYNTKNLSGRKKQAMDFFINKGVKPYHAAGIVANLLGESNLNPKAINPVSGAYGSAQWLGPRKTQLFKKYGKSPDLNQQLEFIWEELQTTENKAYQKLLSTTNEVDATKSFMQHFERPSKREMEQSIKRRLKFANELLR